MKIARILIFVTALAVACTSAEKETPSGLKFKIAKKGDGILPKTGEIVLFNYSFIDSKDSVWMDTFKEPFPPAMAIADSSYIISENSLIQMLRMLSKGDSVNLNLSVKDFFMDMFKAPVPAEIDSTLTLTYSLKVNDIMSRDSFMTYQQNFMMKQSEEQLAKDIVEIDNYLAANNIVAEKTESGLRYVVMQPGSGENAVSGQTVKVNYTGYLLTGEFFDSSVKSVAQERGLYNPQREPYDPIEVTIDQTSVIKGWHETLKLMNKGSKVKVFIPSPLAYGPRQRSEVIKPNAILVFEMELVSIN